MANVVGERFQITIDKKVRRELGIKPGDLAVERVDGRIVVDFVPKPHRESMRGIFREPGRPPITDRAEAKDRAWAMRTAEIMDVLRRDVDSSVLIRYFIEDDNPRAIAAGDMIESDHTLVISTSVLLEFVRAVRQERATANPELAEGLIAFLSRSNVQPTVPVRLI